MGRHRALLGFWAGLALLNLSAGLVIASWPERQSDLELVRSWTSDWLLRGSDVYSSAGAPDYPPHAIVAFSPLAAVPDLWRVPAWGSLNIALSLLAPYLALRSVRPTMTLPEAALPVLMFLTWGGFRTLLQFTLFAVTFGLLSMAFSEKPAFARQSRAAARLAPMLSGLCLALALTKPQVGAPFLLWALFTRRLRIMAVALAAIAIALAVYCARAQANPLHVVARYSETLWIIYTGDTVLIGLAQLRPLWTLLFSDLRMVDAIAATIALLMLALVIGVGFAEAGRHEPRAARGDGAPQASGEERGEGPPRLNNRRVLYGAPALAGLWSLLSFYHLTYGFVLLLPAAAVLMLADDPRTEGFRKTLFWILQLGLMVDVPSLWRRVESSVTAPAWIDAFATHADRILMLVLFAGMLRLAIRPLARREDSPFPHRDRSRDRPMI